MKKIFSLSFILLMIAISSIAQKNVADTSSRKWNGVWDSTDPNCPCYDIQKQAEKEYQEMLKKEQKNEEAKNNIGKDSSLVQKKMLIDGTGISDEQNIAIKNNRTDNTSDLKTIKHKANNTKRIYNLVRNNPEKI